MPFSSVNPTTGELLENFPLATSDAVETALARAATGFAAWRKTPIAERAAFVGTVGRLLEQNKERLGTLATLEMGKPIGAGIGEVEKCAGGCRYYAEKGPALLADEEVREPNGVRELLHHAPLGVVLSIMPWNFPYWQTLRFAAPALVAGNVVLFKPAPSTPQCGLALQEIFEKAGAPSGVFQTLFIEPDVISKVVADPRVAAVTLTGSERAGAAVAAAAGAALKKSVLELGGSDPFIVLGDADLDRAVATAVKARMVNVGQSCIAAKRFIVVESIYDAFRDRFVAAVRALKVGDPMTPGTEIGPLATRAIRDGLHAQVRRTVAAGAKVLVGGESMNGPGFFFAPTVLESVPIDSPGAREELFGPVAALFRVRDRASAVTLANATPFGLGAAVFTQDAAQADACAREIDAGMVFINDMVASDARYPFGGIKRSGYGRELGAAGIRELTNLKRVRVAGIA